jgi:hypothetical protein
MVFIDLERAYDKIPRNLMWWALDKHKVPTKYVTLIKDMYDKVVTSVRTTDGDTNVFLINIGLHQGSALSPYLFALVIDEVTRDIQGDIPWRMFFANDVIVGDLFSNAMNQEQGNTKMLNIKYPSSAEALSPQGFNELRTKNTNIILQR